jgi:hypothetical protein
MAGQLAHLDEAVNKTRAVFGDFGDAAIADARTLADAYGMSFADVLDKQSLLGASLTGAGFSEKAAANYADVFTRLANDMTRRWDVEGGMSESLDRLMAGLRGSAESLERFGVNMTEGTVEARAYSMGLARVGQDLSEAAKKQARAGIIMEQLRSSIGAAADESGSFGSNVEALSGRWENLTTQLGEAFAPTLGGVMGDLGVFLKVMENGWAANKDGLHDLASSGLGGLEGLAGGVGIVQGSVMALADSWQVVRLAFGEARSWIIRGQTEILDSLSEIVRFVDWVSPQSTLADGFARRGKDDANFFDVWAEELSATNAKLINDLKAQWAEPWASEGFSKQFDAARATIAGLQHALASKPMDLMKDVGAAGVAAKLVREGKPYGEAVLAGSAEASKAMARARHATGSNSVEKTSKQTADNTRRSVIVQERMKTSLTDFLDRNKVATVVSM